MTTSKLLLVILFSICAVGLSFAGPVRYSAKVAKYIEDAGGSVSIEKLVLTEKDGGRILYWGYSDIPQPADDALPGDDEVIAAAEAKAAEQAAAVAALKVAVQEAKPAKRKSLEKKAMAFIKGEVQLAGKSPTADEILSMYAKWDDLPEKQGDEKAAKFERLMRPIRLLGGSELDLYDHE